MYIFEKNFDIIKHIIRPFKVWLLVYSYSYAAITTDETKHCQPLSQDLTIQPFWVFFFFVGD